MLHIVKTSNLITKRTPLLCGLLFAAVLLLLPISARAQCTNWLVAGQWHLYQEGIDRAILLTLEQNGRYLTGTASTATIRYSYEVPGQMPKVRNLNGKVTGTIDGDSFSVEIAWPDNLTGVYEGRILPRGKMNGGTYDKNNPKIQQPWHTEIVARCAPAPLINPRVVVQSTPPRPKPIKSSGKARPSQPAPPPPPMKVPGIVASPVVFQFPQAPSGFVILQWDGGPDHPYAEVWVKVDGGDETFVVEHGKGGRQVTVERGRVYEYILTDAGKTLATVMIVGQ